MINYCFVQVYIGTYNHLEAYNCNFFYAHFFVCNVGHQRANYQLFTTNNIPYRLFSTYSWTIMEMENPGTKGLNATVFFFTLRFKAKYQTKHLKDTKLQLDLTNLHSAFENSLLLQSQNHFPWICPLVIYYQLLIFKLPLLHLHFVKTIKSSRYHTN